MRITGNSVFRLLLVRGGRAGVHDTRLITTFVQRRKTKLFEVHSGALQSTHICKCAKGPDLSKSHLLHRGRAGSWKRRTPDRWCLPAEGRDKMPAARSSFALPRF
ncbi:hypothetical protein DACRYDRAFT_22978 [Dacryopinax primogenitus]|uniref:Uncharacterized protein n=1 Tax=Dacryopinax primogenitus (strain DJM 731) TaxID=1858805 RepID=M5G3V2_DACPD|nr:uncharacterized protein DACRYDRAFT_22978 [Dacryopinax primogenitus]EJU00527.1 hypothetical protein DACRYDRAFT_22978 [Dacryopinax primogenitus]